MHRIEQLKRLLYGQLKEMLKIPFYIIVLCCGFAASTTSGVVVCETETDCIPEEATCVENVCVCPKDQTLSYDGTKCLKYAVTYNAQCIEDVQCALLLGKHACVDSRCRCQNGWKYFWGRCIKRAEIGMECKGNEDCFNGIDFFASSCNSEGICECNSGYYARGKFDCRPISTADDGICAIDMDCQYENAYCRYGRCATKTANDDLKFARAFLDDPESKLKISQNRDLNVACKENTDCTTENSHCHLLFRFCVCDRGHYETDGKCIAELGVKSNCNIDLECKMPNSKCTDKVCTCLQTHVYGDGNQLCRKSTTSPDYPCASDESCALFGENYYCDYDEELFVKKCVCTMGSKFDPEHALCLGNALECNSDYLCKSTKPNSWCDNFKCVCKENFMEVDGTCMPLIDGICETNEDCSFVANTECNEETKTCMCTKDMVKLDNEKCIAIAEGLKSECVINEQCSMSVSNSECKNLLCACSEQYVTNNNECVKDKLHESYCESNEACLNAITSGFLCKNSRCECPAGMKVQPDKRGCSKDGGSSSLRTAPVAVLSVLILAVYKLV